MRNRAITVEVIFVGYPSDYRGYTLSSGYEEAHCYVIPAKRYSLRELYSEIINLMDDNDFKAYSKASIKKAMQDSYATEAIKISLGNADDDCFVYMLFSEVYIGDYRADINLSMYV